LPQEDEGHGLHLDEVAIPISENKTKSNKEKNTQPE